MCWLSNHSLPVPQCATIYRPSQWQHPVRCPLSHAASSCSRTYSRAPGCEGVYPKVNAVNYSPVYPPVAATRQIEQANVEEDTCERCSRPPLTCKVEEKPPDAVRKLPTTRKLDTLKTAPDANKLSPAKSSSSSAAARQKQLKPSSGDRESSSSNLRQPTGKPKVSREKGMELRRPLVESTKSAQEKCCFSSRRSVTYSSADWSAGPHDMIPAAPQSSTPETEYRNCFNRPSMAELLLVPHQTSPLPAQSSMAETEYRQSFHRPSMAEFLLVPHHTSALPPPPQPSTPETEYRKNFNRPSMAELLVFPNETSPLPPPTPPLSTPETKCRRNVSHPSMAELLLVPHETSPLPPPPQNSFPETEYRNSFNRGSLASSFAPHFVAPRRVSAGSVPESTEVPPLPEPWQRVSAPSEYWNDGNLDAPDPNSTADIVTPHSVVIAPAFG
ncbi:unnamed protein product [Dibothriocephalus latus]|uniref:Uncharacterized protein n=1 Tax=Dibothriocephalus latus TaxID=60516 RepID=A0A3P7LFM9_DIBLA|nr:unnamed protein product [Dibothriocephalus latus]